MRKHLRVFSVALAVVAALALTVTKRGPAMLVGLGRTTGAASAERRSTDVGTSLDALNKTLGRVIEAYVDPTRIDPKQMLLSSLDSIQKQVAEVMVEPHPERNTVVVRVDTASREFRIDGVDSPWTLEPKLAEIFQFITQNLLPGTDNQAIRNIEYAAVNGMLSTLDPHSILLDPQTYKEMKMSTRGSFGGLGIVIGIRKSALTVIRPMRNTPASDAGVRKGDRIVKIEHDATTNMALQDAVDRLRGDPGTKVEVWMERDGDKAPRRLVLTRAEIQVPSVQSHVLKTPSGNIGYLRLSQFNQKSDEDIRQALEEHNRKNQVKGIVLDLRQDPGGLLDKATKIADEFLESGTIVTTVGYANKQREEKRATPAAQPRIPVAVLVDGQSASASEIVAGALKNLDRAVVIGSRTFGKGSVQVLYDNDDGSALKLTIAQYLTPGDLSIQSVGIMPDVVLEPMWLEKTRMSLFSTYKGTREQDLDAHLTSQNAQSNDKPVETLRYIWSDPRKAEKNKAKPAAAPEAKKSRGPNADGNGDDDDDDDAPDDLSTDDEEAVADDFVIQYARDMLSTARGWKRHEVLAGARDFFASKQTEEANRLTEALRKFNVDWTKVGDKEAAPQLEATVTTDKPENAAQAGETITFTASLVNRGSGPAGQVRAQLKSDNYLYEDREFVFGRIGPGETRTWTIPVKVPKDTLPRLDTVRVQFFEQRNFVPATKELRIRLSGQARPRFAYSYQMIDDGPNSNGDGLLQRGESVRLRVHVKNTGEGRAAKSMGLLRNLSGESVQVNKGRFDLPELMPGEQKVIDFTFDVKEDFSEKEVRVDLQVYDFALHEGVTDKLRFNVADNRIPGKPASGAVVFLQDSDVRSGASADAQVIGRVRRGLKSQQSQVFPGYVRVELEPGRPGFVASSFVGPATDSAGPAAAQALSLQWQVTPPVLDVKKPPLFVDGERLPLSVVAHDEEQVIDAYVVVSNRVAKIEHRKVFYRSNRKSANAAELRFDAEVPLWPGVNVVSVVARQSSQVQSTQTLIVNRFSKDGKDIAAVTR